MYLGEHVSIGDYVNIGEHLEKLGVSYMYEYQQYVILGYLDSHEYQCFLEPLTDQVKYRSNDLIADLCHSVFALGRGYCL